MYADRQMVALNPMGERDRDWGQSGSEAGRKPVTFVGDSRVKLWSRLPLADQLTGINRGIGGESTAQLLLRLNRDVLAEHPRLVVVQCGINDLKSIGVMPERRDRIVRDCIDNLRSTVERLRDVGIPVVMTTIWPCGRPGLAHRPIWSDETHAARLAVNRELLSWKLTGVSVVDCDILLSKEGICRSEFTLDHLHFNSKAYETLNGCIAPVIIECVTK